MLAAEDISELKLRISGLHSEDTFGLCGWPIMAPNISRSSFLEPVNVTFHDKGDFSDVITLDDLGGP